MADAEDDSEFRRELRAQLAAAVRDRDIYKGIAAEAQVSPCANCALLRAERDDWRELAERALGKMEQVLEEREPVMHFVDGAWQPEVKAKP